MKRKHKSYSRPKRPYDKKRIEEESVVIEKYGLKNKKEIWKAEARINVIRKKAKSLIGASEEEKEAFFKRLRRIGLHVNSIADVLSLTRDNYLNRRLQTVITEKKIAPTIKAARQFIVHKKILVDGEVVNSPAYVVSVESENKISLKQNVPRIKREPIEVENGN